MSDSTSTLVFQRAAAEHAQLVSELALRSKAFWGYSDEFMRNCKEELSYSAAEIELKEFSLLLVKDEPVGFSVISILQGSSYTLGGLFIEPCHMGRGYGSALLNHAIDRVRQLGGTELCLDADPNATGFYLRHGAVVTGESESGSIPGRLLPAMSIAL